MPLPDRIVLLHAPRPAHRLWPLWPTLMPGTKPVVSKGYMVVTANPLASQAGCEVLKKGGSAVDAAVAVQAVLGLVEPQSSGLGGGAFMLHYNAKTGVVQACDGREQAPAAATQDYLRYISATNTAYPLPTAASVVTDGAAFNGVRASGRSVGTPGAVRMLELAYQDNGKLPWSALFASGIKLATDGFKISGRMADAIVLNKASLLVDADATAYFYGPAPDYAPKPLGTLLAKDDLRGRANLIRFDKRMGTAGVLPGFVPPGVSDAEGRGTSHMTIVDAAGTVVVMTTTVESSMGSFRMTKGFLLNNQLTDFSSAPSDAAGPIANRVGQQAAHGCGAAAQGTEVLEVRQEGLLVVFGCAAHR